MQPVELTVGELLLRPWRADDAEAVHAAAHDPSMRQWHSAESRTLDGARARLARLADWSTGDHCSWAVEDAGVLVGSVSLHQLDLEQGEGEVGYWTVAAARGRGIAARSADAACRWGFSTLELDRVQLFHAVENVASGRVAATAGFTLEGRLRRSHRYADGVRHDELLWSRLSDDPPPPFGSSGSTRAGRG